MSSFYEVTRYLQRTPARVSTDDDLKQSGSLIDPLKYTKRTPAREIKAIPYSFTIPQYQFGATTTDAYYGYYIGGQINVSVPAAFRLLNPMDIINNTISETCTIRYRVGNVATRYNLYPSVRGDRGYVYIQPLYSFINVPLYTNQIIAPNFVIEFWLKYGTDFVIMKNSITLKTSLLSLPPDANVTSINFNPMIKQVDLPELLYNLPANPVNHSFTPSPNISWLDNPQ